MHSSQRLGTQVGVRHIPRMHPVTAQVPGKGEGGAVRRGAVAGRVDGVQAVTRHLALGRLREEPGPARTSGRKGQQLPAVEIPCHVPWCANKLSNMLHKQTVLQPPQPDFHAAKGHRLSLFFSYARSTLLA